MRTDPSVNGGAAFYFQQDHEGSVTYLTYDAPPGQTPILEYYRYDVFGQPAIYGPDNQVRQASLYSNRFLFTGREYNANFGFYEYRARAYHPGLGRFMSEDPKLFDAGDYNLFRYCHNDPLDMTDPMGLGVDWQVPPSNLVALNLQTAMKQLQRQLADLTERAQSTSEMEHSYLGSARLQQGWQKYGQGLTLAQATAQQLQSAAAKYRLLPIPNQTENHGDYKLYSYQLANSKGEPIKQADWQIQERLLSSSPPGTGVNTTQRNPPMPLTSKGIFRDQVGLVKAPQGDFHTMQIFGYQLWRYGYPYGVSTQIRHDISRVNGVLEIDASIYKP